MPTVTYMGNDVRHDHSFRVPRPDQSVRYGTPNTCTQCHSDRSTQWAADAVVRWYGPVRAPHFSDRLLAGTQLDAKALNALLDLLSDTATPAIIRATALHHMDALPERRSYDALLASLKDRDAQVRQQAIMGLSAYPSAYWSGAVVPLLKDAVRAVRIEAARALATLPPDQFDRNTAPGFAKTNDELMAMLRTQSDMTTGALARADHAMRTGDAAQAERQYLRALQMDSLANYARLNLATLYNAQGRNAEAEIVLRQALAIDAENARIPASLALLLGELQRPKEALAFFEQAEALGTKDERVYVNHSALLQQQGDMPGARAVLDLGLMRFPTSADLLAETAGLLLRLGRGGDAKAHLQRLRTVAPNDPRVAQLQAYMEEQRSR
jgi:Flp pilus assembly protein TadD